MGPEGGHEGMQVVVAGQHGQGQGGRGRGRGRGGHGHGHVPTAPSNVDQSLLAAVGQHDLRYGF